MRLSYTHESIRLTGRWDTRNPAYAEATATGSYIEFAFRGRNATALFDIEANNTPLLHLWVELDGVRIEATIDRYLRVCAPTDGQHVCRIIFKSTSEVYRRWYLPLQSKVSFIGVNVEAPAALPADKRPIIEFVGDSITEGVLTHADYCEGSPEAFPIDQHNRIYQDDVCETYAWLIAEALDLRPCFMGYGGVGVTHAGCGDVPAAPLSYPYNFEGSPITRQKPDIILINHGANDRRREATEYVENYRHLLEVVRVHNPEARIVTLSAFCGGHHEALGKLIADYNREHGTDILFVDSFGWIPEEPLHPLGDGHTIVVEHLVPILREWM